MGSVLQKFDADASAVEKELATLLAHGMLHLLGYDHEDSDEEAEMAARQEAVLTEVLKIE